MMSGITRKSGECESISRVVEKTCVNSIELLFTEREKYNFTTVYLAQTMVFPL